MVTQKGSPRGLSMLGLEIVWLVATSECNHGVIKDDRQMFTKCEGGIVPQKTFDFIAMA